jgi:sugar phosphate isomerase/epimerase
MWQYDNIKKKPFLQGDALMPNLNRRDWNMLAFGSLIGLALPINCAGESKKGSAKPNSKINNVQIGVQSYSLRDRPLDQAVEGMVKAGISSCELWQGHIEPKVSREELRKWRLGASLTDYKAVRTKFDRAGIKLYAYNYSFRDDFTDEEIERGFQMAKALGTNIITASATVSVAKRVDQYAKKYGIYVGMHNHSKVDNPNEYATPESFQKAMEGASKYIQINLDIGHFTAANFDAVDFIRKHHQHIVALHIKDRKRDQGENVPFGQGDTPIKQVLTLLRDNKYSFPANIEYEYKGGDTIEEIKNCLEYCKQALKS